MLKATRLLLLLFAFFSIMHAKAQSATFTAAVQNLQACGTGKQFSVTVNNPGVLLSDYQFDVTVPVGIYLSSPNSTASGISYSGMGTNKLTVLISNFAGGVSHTVNFTATAGCTFPVSGSASAASLNVSAQTSAVSNFSVTASSNGDLNLQLADPSWHQLSNINNNVTRRYVLKNTTVNSFSGTLHFNDEPGSSLSLQSITVTLPDGSIKTISNGGTAEVTGIAPDASVIITEVLRVNTCLNSTTQSGTSNATISSGCFAQDLCRSTIVSTTVGDDGRKPQIKMLTDPALTNASDHFSCFGATGFTDMQVSWTNEGAVAANNIMLKFDVSDNALYVSPSSVRVQITNTVTGKNVAGTVHRAAANQAPAGEEWTYYSRWQSWSAPPLEYLKDFIVPSASIPSPVYTYTPAYQDHLKRLLITELSTANGIQQIDLEQGDIITVFWQEKANCFSPEDLSRKYMVTPSIEVWGFNSCTNKFENIDNPQWGYRYAAAAQEIGLKQQVLPYIMNLNGNPDKCMGTFDGEIRSFSIQNKGFDTYLIRDNNLTSWGDLQVDLVIDEGADLDLSLNGTAQLASYAGECAGDDCGKTTCAKWLATDPGRYVVRYTSTRYGDWLPVSVVKLTDPAEGKSAYRITFDINSYFNENIKPAVQNPSHVRDLLIAAISELRLDFTLRSFCTSEDVTHVNQIVSYVPPCNLCAIPLASQTLKLQVTCPGCTTPGSNITSATLQRGDESVGFTDVLNDAGQQIDNGVPDNNIRITDPLLRSTVTNADVLNSVMHITLSDGDNAKGGFEVVHLNKKGILLDNLYLMLELGKKGLVELLPGSITTVSINGGPEFTVDNPLAKDTSRYIWQVKASDLGLTSFNGTVGQDIVVKSRFRVNPLLSQTGMAAGFVYNIYSGAFSDCDNCQTEKGYSFSGYAGNITCSIGTDPVCPGLISDMEYMCTNSMSMINFIPSTTRLLTGFTGERDCRKTVTMVSETKMIDQSEIYSRIDNAFQGEYRSFIAGKQLNFSCPLPAGYNVTAAVVKVGHGISYSNFHQEYIIPSGQLANYISSTGFSVQLSFTDLPVNWSLQNINAAYTGQALYGGDEYSQVVVELTLDPANCAATPPVITFYEPIGNETPKVIPAGTPVYNLPALAHPDMPNLLAGTSKMPDLHHAAVGLFKSETDLIGYPVNGNQLHIRKGRFYIPVKIDNSFPVDAAGNQLTGLGGDLLPSVKAESPFMYIENIAALNAAGITVSGVYEGNHSSDASVADFANLLNAAGIAGLKKGTNNYFAASSTDNVFTIVADFTCPSGCSPVLPDNNYADDMLPACVKDPKIMKIKYGYTCGNYPANVAEASNACHIKQIEDINIHTPSVAADFTASFVNGNTTPLCSTKEYEVVIKSVKMGPMKNVTLQVTLPAGLTYVGNDRNLADINSLPNVVKFSDVEKLHTGDYNDGAEIRIKLMLSVGCMYSNGSVSALLTAGTYCGTTFTRTRSATLQAALSQHFDPVILSGINCSATQVIVNYTANVATVNTNKVVITIPSGFAFANGGGTIKTINIPSGTIGANSITESLIPNNTNGTYTINARIEQTSTIVCGNTSCTRTNRINASPCTFTVVCPTANAGPDKEVCAYENVTLSANSLPGATYSWTSSPAGFAADSREITVSTGSTTTYTVAVTSNGCTKSDFAEVKIKPRPAVSLATSDGLMSAIIPSCRAKVTLAATPGHASYQWSENGTVISGAAGSTLEVTKAGTYSVHVTGTNGCTNSASINVISSIEITGKSEICPYENPNLQLSIGGASGQFLTQWFKDDAMEPTVTPAGTAGNYYAIVVMPNITPACTLRTDNFLVTQLNAPAKYTVSSEGNLLRCPGDVSTITLTATAPASSDPSITSWSWSNGQVASPITVNGSSGSYFVTAIGSNGCKSISNSITIVSPHIYITQECLADGRTALIASMNVIGNGYTWSNAQGAALGTSESVIVNQDGVFTVSSGAFNCNVSATSTVCRSSDQANMNVNVITDGDFDRSKVSGNTSCNPFNFSSDLSCASTPLTVNNWPGNFKLSNNAGAENGTSWSGSGFYKPGSTDNYFLLADGPVTAQSKRVWYKTVSVENCAYYSFSALINNIIINEAEVPGVYLEVDGTRINHRTFFANQTDWIQLSGRWKSPKTGTVEIGIWIDGGGWVGRDIGIDEISFSKVDCSSLNNGPRVCNAVANVGSSKYICAGGSIQIGNNISAGGLTYSWKDASGTEISTEANPIVNPSATATYTLTVTDAANNCSASDVVTVNVISPAVTITMSNPDNCNVTFIASQFNGVGNVSYRWYVNDVAVATNTSGVFVSSNIKQNDLVKCQLLSACTSQPFSNIIKLTAPVFYVDLGQDRTVCSGSPALTAATPLAATFSWSTGMDSPSINVSAAGTYTVTATSSTGCVKSDQVVISYELSPAVPSVSADVAKVCANGTNNITHGFVPGIEYEYILPAGASIQSIIYPTATTKTVNVKYGTIGGNVTVTVTGSGVCTASASVLITVPPVPVLSYTLNSKQCNGLPVMMNGTASANETDYYIEIYKVTCPTCTSVVNGTYYSKWFAGEAGNINLSSLYAHIGFQAGGIYRVKLALANSGCSWTEKVTVITISNTTPVSSFTLPSTVCAGQPVTMDGTASIDDVNHFIEVFKTNCVGCTAVTGNLRSGWTPGAAGVTDLRTMYPFFTAGGIYKVKLAVQSNDCPWVETSKWVQITSCREDDLMQAAWAETEAESHVYANPAVNEFKVELPVAESAVIQLVNTEGKVVVETKTTAKITQVDISDIISGFYIVNIIRGEKVEKKKLEVMK